jgi:hypothetical protein
LFGLAIVGLAAYTPWLGLAGDDWWFFAHLSDGDFVDLLLFEHPTRPMVAVIWAVLWKVFGLRPLLYYAVCFAAQWLTAVVFLVTLQRIFGWTRANALAAAALVL